MGPPHKLTPCTQQEKPDLPPPSPQESLSEQPLTLQTQSLEEDGGASPWRLQRAQLETLAADNKIRELLKDFELQGTIKAVDSAADAEKELGLALENSEYLRVLADHTLSYLPRDASFNSQAP
eukprot:jgi/Mesen1/2467/ME000158S01665